MFQLLQEIEARATLSQQQLQVVRGQVAAKQKDIRLNQLTIKELEPLQNDTNVYEGVGKMSVSPLLLWTLPLKPKMGG